MSKIHLEILDKERQSVFHSLAVFKKNCYLAGETALALQLAHRESFDFDIFINNPVSATLKAQIKELFGDVAYYVDSKEQISFRTQNNIHITFLWYYFNTLFPLLQTDSLPLASFKDIAADKAHTIGRRAAWRDYVDFYFLLHKPWVPLEEIIVIAKKKFKKEFNEVLFLQQLVYFEDLERTPISYINASPDEKEIIQFPKKHVKAYAKNLIQ